MTFGQFFGAMAGCALALAIVLLIPGDQSWAALFLAISLSIFGQFAGKAAFR